MIKNRYSRPLDEKTHTHSPSDSSVEFESKQCEGQSNTKFIKRIKNEKFRKVVPNTTMSIYTCCYKHISVLRKGTFSKHRFTEN